jgi:hypothetical protein
VVNTQWDLQARSISRRLGVELQAATFRARVLAAFDRACNLVSPDGLVIALVLPQIGDGPLNIVVDGAPGDFSPLVPGMPAWLSQECLQVGGLSISLARASVWEPRPEWRSLRACRQTITQRLCYLQHIALRHAPEGSLLTLFPNGPATVASGLRSGSSNEGGRLATMLFAVAQAGAEAVRCGWRGDTAELRSGAAQLAGLGGGLTPAGDDFLTGLMLWAWLAHPTPQRLCQTLTEAAAPRTTLLSAALLKVAAAGECNAAWHQLLHTLARGENDQVTGVVENVLSHGHTSGADALAGFLWLSRQTGPICSLSEAR